MPDGEVWNKDAHQEEKKRQISLGGRLCFRVLFGIKVNCGTKHKDFQIISSRLMPKI